MEDEFAKLSITFVKYFLASESVRGSKAVPLEIQNKGYFFRKNVFTHR